MPDRTSRSTESPGPAGLPDSVLCAPASFKETLAAERAAAAMAAGVERAGARADRCPVADGGDGSLGVLSAAVGAVLEPISVTGPLGGPVVARLGIAGPLGLVELAEASGLRLVPPGRRDPGRTTSRGTGELVAEAARRGCDEVIVCLGGSATVDGGAGIAQALGVVFLDRAGRPIREPLSGDRLRTVAGWRPPPGPVPRLRAACDVTSPLLGPTGAAATYGPQKGASPAQVRELEAALAHLAAAVGGDPDRPGAGAAGGAGWGLETMLGARLEPGAELVLETIGFDRRCAAADMVLTGEGSLDRQTLLGKACVAVARAARRHGVPVIAVAGRVAPDPDVAAAFTRTVGLAERFGPARALSEPAALLERVAEEQTRRGA